MGAASLRQVKNAVTILERYIHANHTNELPAAAERFIAFDEDGWVVRFDQLRQLSHEEISSLLQEFWG